MSKINPDFKEEIKKLDKKTLEQIILKLVAKNSQAYDFVSLNYINKENGEVELFEQTKADLEIIYNKRYKGFSDELRKANMLAIATKRVTEFTKLSKNKRLEALLLLDILEVSFSVHQSMFGTCFVQFDSRVARILAKLINIVNTKIPEDYKLDFTPQINEYLKRLKGTSRFLNPVYSLPDFI